MGKFIVLYGANNLGKSRQLDLLEDRWRDLGRGFRRIKYPIYGSFTGEVINAALRGEKEERLALNAQELQFLFAEDRRLFEPELWRLLSMGDVLAEDYVGTGLAWGLTFGVDRGVLNEYNSGLLRPDIEILLDGERFTGGIERGHRHEGAGNEIWEKNRKIHLELAREFGWETVQANGSEQEVHERIMGVIRAVLTDTERD